MNFVIFFFLFGFCLLNNGENKASGSFLSLKVLCLLLALLNVLCGLEWRFRVLCNPSDQSFNFLFFWLQLS